MISALFKNWIPILFAGIFLFLIFNFIEMIWLKWFLAVMTGGAFFYSKKSLRKNRKIKPRSKRKSYEKIYR